MRQRSILCVQLEHFYACVAGRRAGEVAAGKCVAVVRAGRILDAAPEAVEAGLRPGMRLRQARRWFPDALFLPTCDEEYPEHARPVLEICAAHTPLVEPETPARIFLDVTGCEALYGSAEAIAGRLARRIPAETGFACVVGGGRTRLVAAQAAPQRRMIPDGEEREFLAPLPLAQLGTALDTELREWLELRSVTTFGDVLKLPEGALWRRFGVRGERLARLAAGRDSTPVRPAYPPRSVEARVECEAPPETEEQVQQYLSHLAVAIAGGLGKTRDTARRYRLILHFREGDEVSASERLPAPAGSVRPICQSLVRLHRRLAPDRPPCALSGTAEEITAGEAFQGSLFPELEEDAGAERERERRLNHVLGLLSQRFGPTAVAPGSHLWTSRRPRFLDRVLYVMRET